MKRIVLIRKDVQGEVVLMQRVKDYINGQWVESETKEFGNVWCPATGEKICETPFSTAAEVDRAVQAAKNALWEWRCTPPLTRALFLQAQGTLGKRFRRHRADPGD